MRVSIVTPILNSHEIVRRQILHYESMKLPENMEIIFVDDGSNPPLVDTSKTLKNFRIICTNDPRPWTEHIARNIGVRESKGEYIFLVDIDYIVPRRTMRDVVLFNGDRMHFRRRFGVLDENGNIDCTPETLRKYDLKEKWMGKKWIKGHRSQFVMRKDLFWKLGGYNESLDGEWRTTGGAGEKFWRFWQRAEEMGEVTLHNRRTTLFVYPNGKFCNSEDKDFNPFGLFHNLKHGS